ncbi:MAG: tyrosine-type recombinase/integrase [Halothiobacillaceae bacterium]|nr:tyrosine-type recombinase/integrase [Halothiobacillaceae bacterium]
MITVKELEAIKPGDKEIVVDVGEGLRLRIYPSGKRAWVLRYQLNGNRQVMALGSYEFMSLKAARRSANEARKLIDQGIDPKAHAQETERARIVKIEAERLAHESRRLFKPTAERWMELEISQRKQGASEMLRSFTKDVFPFIGEREIGSIKRQELIELLDIIKARGSSVQANRTLTAIKQLFNWCVLREYLDSNPLAMVKKSKIGGAEKERERTLSESEIRELCDKLPDAGLGRATELSLWILLSTAARVGEIIQARWSEVDLDNGVWTIPARTAKNGKAIPITLSNFALRHFKELREIHHWNDWDMPSTKKDGYHVCEKSITRQVKDRQTDAPFSGRSKAVSALILSGGNWTPHDLRRTAATMMRGLGTSSDVIEKCLNHTEQNKLIKTYQQADLSGEMRTAWIRLGEKLSEVLNLNLMPKEQLIDNILHHGENRRLKTS